MTATVTSDRILNDQKCFALDCDDVALIVKFSPYEWSSNLIAIGSYTQVFIVACKLKEKGTLDGIEFDRLAEFHHTSRIADLAWSPETNVNTLPRVVKFFSCADRNVHCFISDMKGSSSAIVVGEHTDYVNAVASQPDTGDKVASVSDDLTCCIWSTSPCSRVAQFPLTSPGMAVCWHPQESSKIMVAEQKGVIRFYSVVTQQAFISLDCTQSPLVSADWCHTNSLRVAALADTDWFVFDTSRSSLPFENHQAHSAGGRTIRWCHSHEHLLATTGRPGVQLKVFNMRTNQVVLTVDMKVSSGLCWHSRLPILAAGVDNQVRFWTIEMF